MSASNSPNATTLVTERIGTSFGPLPPAILSAAPRPAGRDEASGVSGDRSVPREVPEAGAPGALADREKGQAQDAGREDLDQLRTETTSGDRLPDLHPCEEQQREAGHARHQTRHQQPPSEIAAEPP